MTQNQEEFLMTKIQMIEDVLENCDGLEVEIIAALRIKVIKYRKELAYLLTAD